jgi:hypothetical protein
MLSSGRRRPSAAALALPGERKATPTPEELEGIRAELRALLDLFGRMSTEQRARLIEVAGELMSSEGVS